MYQLRVSLGARKPVANGARAPGHGNLHALYSLANGARALPRYAHRVSIVYRQRFVIG